MNENTVGLSLKEAAVQAEAELALSDADGSGADTTLEDALDDVSEVEQPTVEKETDTGLLDSLVDDAEQPSGDSVIIVDGQEYTADDVRNGLMMQADYTRKTQGIADREREADNALTLMRLLEERPVETIRKLYQQINTGEPIQVPGQQTTPTGQEQTPTDVEALVEARVAALLDNDPRIKAMENTQAQAQVDAEFTAIEDMYGVELSASDKQQVLEEAVSKDTSDLKFVFGGLYAQAMRAKEAKRNVKDSASSRPTQQEPEAAPQAGPEKFTDFRSALQAELANERAAQSQL